MGAPRVHVVDLDGAVTGELQNLDIITEIAKALLIPTQTGGGIRRLDTIEELLKAGIDRVILGTAAVEDPTLVKEVCRHFSESIIVGIDTWEGLVAIHGWQQRTELRALEFARSMVELGVKRFIYTSTGNVYAPSFQPLAEDAPLGRLLKVGGRSTW